MRNYFDWIIHVWLNYCFYPPFVWNILNTDNIISKDFQHIICFLKSFWLSVIGTAMEQRTWIQSKWTNEREKKSAWKWKRWQIHFKNSRKKASCDNMFSFRQVMLSKIAIAAERCMLYVGKIRYYIVNCFIGAQWFFIEQLNTSDEN